MHRLEKDPLIVVHAVAQMPTILTRSLVQQVLFGALYAPMTSFPLIGYIMDQLYREDLHFLVGGPDLVPFCSSGLNLPMTPDDSQVAIGCSDWSKMVRLPLSVSYLSPVMALLTRICLPEKLDLG